SQKRLSPTTFLDWESSGRRCGRSRLAVHDQLTAGALPRQFDRHPCLRQTPVAQHGLRRNPQHFGSLFYAEAAEEPKLDHPGLSWVEPNQILEGFIHGHQLTILRRLHLKSRVEA